MHLLVLFEIKPKMLYKLNHLSLIKVKKKQSLKFLTNIYLKFVCFGSGFFFFVSVIEFLLFLI